MPATRDAPLSDWVFVDDPDLDEMCIVPCMGDDEDGRGMRSAATTAAMSGAAGLLPLGAVAGSLSTAVREAIRWVRQDSSGSIATSAEAAGALAGRAAGAWGEARRLPAMLRPGLASISSAFSGSAFAERDLCIERLQMELAVVGHEASEERARLRRELAATERSRVEAVARFGQNVHAVEDLWREQNARLTTNLQNAEQARADEQQLVQRKIEAATLAKDEEVGRLVKQLETAERVWQQDTAVLIRELEYHRHERLAESKRLTHELDAAVKAREAASENQERTEKELEAARRQREEQTRSRRCCVCLEAEQQVMFLPCRHVCCCQNCAEAVENCPIDRIVIQQKINFLMV